MKPFYVILSVTGWVWLLALGGYIIAAHRRSAGERDRVPKDGTSPDA